MGTGEDAVEMSGDQGKGLEYVGGLKEEILGISTGTSYAGSQGSILALHGPLSTERGEVLSTAGRVLHRDLE